MISLQVVYALCSSFTTAPERLRLISEWWQPGYQGVMLVDQMPELQSEDLPHGLALQVTSQPWEFVSGAERCAWTQIADAFNLFPQADWFIVGDDDTMFVQDAVQMHLAKYPSSEKWYIGCTSESASQNSLYGNIMMNDGQVMKDFAFGGGGIMISRGLMVPLAQNLPDCLNNYSGLFGGDQRIAVCAKQAGAELTINQGMHQCDTFAEIPSMLEAHPLTPLLSLHKLESLPLSQGGTLLQVISSMRTNAYGIMQQSVCYSYSGLFSVASGLSVRWWAAETHVDLIDLTDSTKQHQLPTDNMRRFSFSSNITEGVGRISGNSVLSVYVADHADNYTTVHQIIVKEPIGPARWLTNQRLTCHAVTEHTFNRTIVLDMGLPQA